MSLGNPAGVAIAEKSLLHGSRCQHSHYDSLKSPNANVSSTWIQSGGGKPWRFYVRAGRRNCRSPAASASRLFWDQGCRLEPDFDLADLDVQMFSG